MSLARAGKVLGNSAGFVTTPRPGFKFGMGDRDPADSPVWVGIWAA